MWYNLLNSAVLRLRKAQNKICRGKFCFAEGCTGCPECGIQSKSILRGGHSKVSKILIVTNHSYMLYRFRLELIQELMKQHEVVLSMPFVGHEDDFRAMGIKCIDTALDRRSINPKKDLELFRNYCKLLKDEKPDLVITYSIKPNIYAGLACSLAGIPYCANVQGLGTAFQKKGLARFVAMLYRVAFRKVRTVFFENEENAQEFRDAVGIEKEKQTVLNGAGINMARYPYREYPENEKTHFLYLGRIMKEKGIDELLAAAEMLRADGENFVVDMVGFFEDEYLEKFNTAQQKGIVMFRGFAQDPRPYYAQADCVVLPSYHEGMSNVLLEAAASGRPIITSRIHGCKEAVVEGETGYLCTVKDAHSLYRTMKQFLALSREQREEMGLKGRSHVENVFKKEKIVQETIAALGLDKL